MKALKTVIVTLLLCLVFSCNSNKETLYGSTWELEYISGPRIAFNGLYPNKKPQITFNKDSQKVEGNNSCNGYSAEYTIDGNTISFGEPGPTTMMFCGQGEKVFLTTIKKINSYSFDANGKLNLMIDDITMMRFHKTQKP
ncbi:META domain-containing protein [Mangrovimonas spongiae]|uniref:META domain-containing protein n=1 Tax=Mangrovimonas spongiae TaxID=2494697 RepID=A0A3R9NQN0_9FLAO|nr:META domain-containing protein [Mangrovimonas spongiae]RSK41347.1 META domain-containing protein [Mangrovimonas spongiae]